MKKNSLIKAGKLLIPVLVLLTGFSIGSIYFFNLEILVRYLIASEGYPLEIDKMDIQLSGDFSLERLKYLMSGEKGIEKQIKVEYTSGSFSPLSLIFSDKLNLDMSLRGCKIPFKDGIISGGTWKLNVLINNLAKNAQQWEGPSILSIENAMLEYTVMNTSYTALIKSGKLTGWIKNGVFQLDESEILTDIAKITIKGNSTIVNPYNVNMEIHILPLDEFGKKYPNEKSMLSALLTKDPFIIVTLNGPVDRLNPQVKNLSSF